MKENSGFFHECQWPAFCKRECSNFVLMKTGAQIITIYGAYNEKYTLFERCTKDNINITVYFSSDYIYSCECTRIERLGRLMVDCNSISRYNLDVVDRKVKKQ